MKTPATTKTNRNYRFYPNCSTEHNKAHLPIVIVLIFLCIALIGCGPRTHMSPEYGQKNREFYQAQRVHEEPSKVPPQGLDSEESSIIHSTYRKEMGGGTAQPKEKGAKVLLIEDKKDD